MYGLIIAACLPAWSIASGLQVEIVVPTVTGFADEKIQFYVKY